MRYRIGEVADFFGMTKEGIRYYERQEIICALRDQKTGYRYYPREEITRLKQIRSYQCLGFSLEESQYMVCDTPYDEVIPRIERKIEELRKKNDALIRMRDQLEKQKSVALRRESGLIEARVVPSILFLRRVPDEASAGTQTARERIVRARTVEKAWIEAMPPVTLFAKHYDRELNPVSDMFGSMAYESEAIALNLPTDETLRLPERLCVCGVTEAPLGEKPPVAHLLSWLQKHNFLLADDIYGALRLVYKGSDGRRWGIHEFFLPVGAGEAPRSGGRGLREGDNTKQ